MKRFAMLVAAVVLSTTFLVGNQARAGENTVFLDTKDGRITIELLPDLAPKHVAQIKTLVKEGFYDGLLFHRVMSNFMAQGGDPDSRNAPADQPLGMGGPGYEIEAEIGAPHIRGALAAARRNNPQKQSSGSQFYIVQGQPIDDAYLNNIEAQKQIKYNDAQRQLYKELGGTPFLDNDYTVFGEVVEGMDVVDKICSQPTGPNDRPLQDIKMTVRILN